MAKSRRNQWSIKKTGEDDDLYTWLEAFLLDRKVQGMSPGTIYFYTKKLELFATFCEEEEITKLTDLTPSDLRDYLLHLEETGHNPGGRHACYRAVKTFLRFWEAEVRPEGWLNPTERVKPPKLAAPPLEPVLLEEVAALTDTCDKSFTGLRDKALFYALLDTGARAKELLDARIEDYDRVSGELMIRKGKGGKARSVFLGKKSRRAMRAYLKARSDESPMLWASTLGEGLTYWGLREVLRRRSALAGIEAPTLHSFRRAFAINMLRAGVDVFSLQKLMGHADLQVLRRYLAQTTEDIQQAHRTGSPVDQALH